ncbi:adenosylmethionine decarboxylase [Clostridia bacterium OttesenSCG-928-F22]|nr:adenosylmethionine decarboxylase [Clostridia bacterium OttesenSCG-928-F22]
MKRKLKWIDGVVATKCAWVIFFNWSMYSLEGVNVMENKLTLYGFNNLTKTLSFNIYDVCYAKSQREQKDYIAYIDQQYNSDRLTNILTEVTEMIGARVLNIAKQDYEPQGASVTLLVAEGDIITDENDFTTITRSRGDAVVGHLDKSHVTVHTYPEYHPDTFLATFRVDIDVATCGEITPLSTLDYLLGSFDSDIITMDYRVRGFTRDIAGKKLFMDHDMTSIQEYIDEKTLRRYDAIDINVYQSNIYHTKMLIKEIDLQNYLFNTDIYELPPQTRLNITNNLRKEMIEIFSGRNVY